MCPGWKPTPWTCCGRSGADGPPQGPAGGLWDGGKRQNPQGLGVYDAGNRPIHSLTCPAQLTGCEYEVLETAGYPAPL